MRTNLATKNGSGQSLRPAEIQTNFGDIALLTLSVSLFPTARNQVFTAAIAATRQPTVSAAGTHQCADGLGAA
jgi:hypothetical protein